MLWNRATGIGTPLKGDPQDSILDLSQGETLEWLGFDIRRADDGFSIRIADRSWKRLDRRLADAYLAPEPSVKAQKVVIGWLAAHGPCFQFESQDKVLSRLRRTAARYDFLEIPGQAELRCRWKDANNRWETFYHSTGGRFKKVAGE